MLDSHVTFIEVFFEALRIVRNYPGVLRGIIHNYSGVPLRIVRNEVRVLIWSLSVKMPLDCTITEKFPELEEVAGLHLRKSSPWLDCIWWKSSLTD